MQLLIVHPINIMRIALSKFVNAIADCRVVCSLGDVSAAIDYLNNSEESIDLILVDSMNVKPTEITRLIEVTAAKVLIISNDDHSPDIDGWVKEGVRGVLSPEADEAQFTKALQKVCQGEYWLNRDVTSRILSGLGGANEPSPEQVLTAQLTAKEKLVIKALVEGQGQTLRATAQGLNISENTVRNHLTSIYAKLGVANRLELFVFAQRFMANV